MSALPGGLYLIDSSAWIPIFRRAPDRTALQQRAHVLVQANTAATTGMVRLELLRGARNEQQLDELRVMLDGLHQLPTDEVAWDTAARIGQRLRVSGITVPSADLLIAAVAIRAEATLLHRDADFETIARHAPLNVESHLGADESRLT